MHKIYSFKTKADYICEVTFYNGDIKKCDMKILIENTQNNGFIFANIEEFKAAVLDSSRENIVWNENVRIDSEKMWYDGVLVGHIELEDPVVRLANLLIETRTAIGISQKELENRTGVKQAEISKIERAVGNPSIKTVGRLFAGMGQMIRFEKTVIGTNQHADIPMLESCAPYLDEKLQGEFTTEDIEQLPEDANVELIDGVLFEMETPTSAHQLVANKIGFFFELFIEQNGGDCTTLQAPTGVWFEEDDKNFVVPDMLVVCDKGKIVEKGILGAPDFILEVLSPSTSARDMRMKRDLYDKKGVREYWIVDLYKKKIIIYDFENNDVEVHGFSDEVEVKIYNGRLVIDFQRIQMMLDDYGV